MEVFVAVLRFKSPDDNSSARRFHGPQAFELLLDSSTRGHGLPRFRSKPNEHPLDCVLRNVQKISRLFGQRAISVPLCVDKPTSSQNTHSRLICVPVLGINSSKVEKISGHRFCNLSHLLNLAIKEDEWLALETRHLITCLDDWLTKHQHSDVQFMSSLFRNRPSIERIQKCVHNPGQNPRINCYCCRTLVTASEVKRKSSELEEAVLNSNNVRAYMLSMEKYKLCLINPVFGGIVTRRMKETAPEYYAKGRRTRQRLKSEVHANAWEQVFRLHAACYAGDSQMVKKLLDHGYNPNELDTDYWTPLHYCTFYNRFEACELLMLHNGTKVNMTNKTGSTALHFAALNGHDLLVELILSHSLIDTNIKDTNGKTALNLCEQVPKAEWIRIAYLLRNSQLRPEKIEVKLAGSSCLQVKCDIETATAGLLREKVLRLEGLTSPNSSRVFAIWIVSERLGLQLKAEKNVKVHLEKWSDHLDKWGDAPLINQSPDADLPKIVLKRDARTLLGDEQELTRQNPSAVRILFDEAVHNYLNGMIPCKDSIKLSAIILGLLLGVKVKQSTIDYKLMTKIMPKHLIPNEDRAYQKLKNKVLEAHATLPQTNVAQLQYNFLSLCWKQKVYGCTFFKALMYRNKPPHASTDVFIGLNDFGVSVINRQTLKQIESMGYNNGVEMEYETGKNYIQVHRRKHDTLVFNTHQAILISNLFTQLKTKVSTAAHVKK